MLRLRSVAASWTQLSSCLPYTKRFIHISTTGRIAATTDTMDRINTTPRLAELRKLMKENNISAYSEMLVHPDRRTQTDTIA